MLDMKVKEKNRAITLRHQGLSIGEIAKKVKVSKSSVSYWVRDIQLTKKQRNSLNRNAHSIDAIEKRRISRLSKTKARQEKIILGAREEVRLLSGDPLWCFGVALYWSEGGKTQRTVRLSNSDPSVIKLMMKFFMKYGETSLEKFRGHVHTFSQTNEKKAVEYWSKISGLPKTKFFKTYIKKSVASKDRRKILPYGTLQIYVHNYIFFYRMMGWIEEIKKNNYL